MKKYLLAISLLFCSFILTAQVIYDPANNQFTLSTIPPNQPGTSNPALIQLPVGTNPGSIVHPPGYAAFVFEFGDGYFTTDINAVHAYAEKRDYKTVLSLSGRYDTIKPPRAFTKTVSFSGMASAPDPQNLLNPNEFVRLTPIANSVNANDEMGFILTYKIPPGGIKKGKLMLFYNNNATAFKPVTFEDSKMMILESIDANHNPGVIKRVRNYFGELLGIPTVLPTVSGLQGSGYQNALVWENLDNLSIEKEYNIFITLRTGYNLPTDNAVRIEAAFVYEQPDNPVARVDIKIQPADSTILAGVSPLTLPVSLYPHDPNYISVLPKCIVKGPGTQKVTYRVHFQNEGGGAAHRLKIKVNIDPALARSMDTLSSSSFRIIAGKKKVDSMVYTRLKTSNSFRIDIFFRQKNSDGSLKKSGMVSEILDSSLSCNQVPFFTVNELTMGDIYFELDAPRSEEADLAADAEITFYAGNNMDMEPVFTKPDTLFIRETCNGNLFPLITPIEKKCECSKCKQPGKCGWLGLYWCWWILITLLLALLAWFIGSRKRNKKADYNT